MFWTASRCSPPKAQRWATWNGHAGMVSTNLLRNHWSEWSRWIHIFCTSCRLSFSFGRLQLWLSEWRLYQSVCRCDEVSTVSYSDRTKIQAGLIFPYRPTLHPLSVPLQFLPWFVKIVPVKFRSWLAENAPSRRVQKLRNVVNIMDRTSVEVFEAKKRALQQGDDALIKEVGQGKDIMTILCTSILVLTVIRLRDSFVGSESQYERYSKSSAWRERAYRTDDVCSLEVIVANSNTNLLPVSKDADFCVCYLPIFSANEADTSICSAMDTISSTLARILHVLAEHPDAQERLRNEITKARAGKEDLDYNDLTTLPYLDAVCKETLRLFVWLFGPPSLELIIFSDIHRLHL